MHCCEGLQGWRVAMGRGVWGRGAFGGQSNNQTCGLFLRSSPFSLSFQRTTVFTALILLSGYFISCIWKTSTHTHAQMHTRARTHTYSFTRNFNLTHNRKSEDAFRDTWREHVTPVSTRDVVFSKKSKLDPKDFHTFSEHVVKTPTFIQWRLEKKKHFVFKRDPRTTKRSYKTKESCGGGAASSWQIYKWKASIKFDLNISLYVFSICPLKRSINPKINHIILLCECLFCKTKIQTCIQMLSRCL